MLTALWDCNGVPLLFNSSLSQWVHACDALDLPMLQREELDAFIDQLYKDIEKGEALAWPWSASSSAVCRRQLETLASIQGLGGVPTGDWEIPLPLVCTSHACCLGLLCG